MMSLDVAPKKPTIKVSPAIQQFKGGENEFIKFIFEKELSGTDAESLCSEWIRISQMNNHRKFVIVFDAAALEDYEPKARLVFQNAINKLRNQILKIWVITNSKLIASGAAIMGIFTSFPIKSVSNEEDIFQ